MDPSPPLGRWKVSFEEFMDTGRRNSSPGFLVLWLSNWLALVNHKDAPLVGKYLNNGEVFYTGSTVRFLSHVALVEALFALSTWVFFFF
jgi:hypothetical protein